MRAASFRPAQPAVLEQVLQERVHVLARSHDAAGVAFAGIIELIAAILLVTPRTVWAGALLSLGTISGAIFSHLTMLGIVVKDDGGLLFGLAVTVFTLSSTVLLIHRRELPVLGAVFE